MSIGGSITPDAAAQASAQLILNSRNAEPVQESPKTELTAVPAAKPNSYPDPTGATFPVFNYQVNYNLNKVILQFRNEYTGKVVDQIPSAQAIQNYRNFGQYDAKSDKTRAQADGELANTAAETSVTVGATSIVPAQSGNATGAAAASGTPSTSILA